MNEITTGHQVGTQTGVRGKPDWRSFTYLELKFLKRTNYKLYLTLFEEDVNKFLLKKYSL